MSEQNYSYYPSGKTNGWMQNIPESQCRICGESIHQPLPTGIWLHTSANSHNDYEEHFNCYGEFEHVAAPTTLIEELLVLNKKEGRQYGHGSCRLHRKYWLQLTDLKGKQIIHVAGLTPKTKKDLRYWCNDCKRLNYLAILKFVISKERIRSKNFPIPKLMVVCKFRDKIIDEFEILLSSDNIIHSWGLNDRIVLVGKKKYVVRGDPYLQRISVKRSEWSFSVKELGKYDKLKLTKFYKDGVKQFRDYFEKYMKNTLEVESQ